MVGMRRIIGWWQSLPFPWGLWRVVGQVSAVDSVPDRLPKKGVVLIGAPGHTTWAAFDCPCGRGHRLVVNLDRSRYPFWSLDSLKPLTIRPSIDDITLERRCHFFLRGGRIAWANYDRSVTR